MRKQSFFRSYAEDVIFQNYVFLSSPYTFLQFSKITDLCSFGVTGNASFKNLTFGAWLPPVRSRNIPIQIMAIFENYAFLYVRKTSKPDPPVPGSRIARMIFSKIWIFCFRLCKIILFSKIPVLRLQIFAILKNYMIVHCRYCEF